MLEVTENLDSMEVEEAPSLYKNARKEGSAEIQKNKMIAETENLQSIDLEETLQRDSQSI